MSSSALKDLLEKAKILERTGDRRKAAAQYASLASLLLKKQKWEQAEILLKRAASLQPDSPRLYVLLGKIAVSLNNNTKLDEAAGQFARSLLSKKGDWEKYREFLEKEFKEMPRARQNYYRAILDLDRTSAVAFVGLAVAQTENGEKTQAKLTLVEALRTKTQEGEVVSRLDELLKFTKDNKGRVHLDNYLNGRLTIDDLASLFSPGGNKTRSETREEERSPLSTDKDLRSMIDELEKEMNVSTDNQYDTVKPLVSEFIRRSDAVIGGDSKARIDMAMAFFEMGLLEEAKLELSHVKETDTQFVQAQNLLGEIYQEEGATFQALEVFQRIARDPRATKLAQCAALYSLAKIYFKLGDYRQSMAQALMVEKIDPSFRDIHHLKFEIEKQLSLLKKTG